MIAIGLLLVAAFVLLPMASVSIDEQETIGPNQAPFDAIVFICMGKWTQTTILEHATASLRETGKWDGPIFVFTDRQDGWPSMAEGYKATIIAVPAQTDKLAIHSYKCQMFNYLPDTIKSVLYMDADIVVARPLQGFAGYLHKDIAAHPAHNMGLFQDAGGHFWRICNDCDYWHGGVMYVSRGSSEPCLEEWCSAIFSGRFPLDQPALDYISKEKEQCTGMFEMDNQYLMFMKDYTAAVLLPTKTFSHVTAAGRLDEQSWFYRFIVKRKLGIDMGK